MFSVRIHLVLPDDLIKSVDELVGKRRRSKFIAAATRDSLKRERLRRAIAEGSGILSEEDYPHWATPALVAEWVRAQRSIPSSGRVSSRRTRTG